MIVLRVIARGLVRSPVYAGATVVVVTVGLGLTLAVWTLADSVLLSSLPYPDADRLVTIRLSLNEEAIEILSGREGPFEALAQYRSGGASAVAGGQPARLRVTVVAPDYFRLFRARPVQGRVLSSLDTGDPYVAVVTPRVWSLLAEQDGLERAIIINERPLRVVGVADGACCFPAGTDIWVPFGGVGSEFFGGSIYLNTVGLLRPGISLEAAQSFLVSRVGAGYAEPSSFVVQHLHRALIRGIDQQLVFIQGVGLLLLSVSAITLAKVQGLRAISKIDEYRTRWSLGATRGHLFAQSAVETFVLYAVGTLAASVLGAWLISACRALLAPDIAALFSPTMSVRVVGAVVLASLGIALSTTLLAFYLVFPRGDWRFGASGAGEVLGQGRSVASKVVVAVEAAVLSCLLVCAFLLVRSFVEVTRIPSGIQGAASVVTFKLAWPQSRSSDETRLTEELLDRVSAHPGILTAGATSHLPFRDLGGMALNVLSERSDPVSVNYRGVTADYFDAMGIPLREGRGFAPDEKSRNTAVLTEEVARRISRHSLVGRNIRIAGLDDLVVVGVVGGVRHFGLERDVAHDLYVPIDRVASSAITVVVRTNLPLQEVVSLARSTLDAQGVGVVPFDFERMSEVVAGSYRNRRFHALIAAAFALNAVLLVSCGVYGTTAVHLSRRRSELAIRLALGATPFRLVREAMKGMVPWVAWGVAIGATGGVLLGYAMAGALHAVARVDVSSVLASAVVVLSATIAAVLVATLKSLSSEVTTILRMG